MYRSTVNGVTVYRGELYNLSGMDIVERTQGTKDNPPKQRTIKAATQEVLQYLYSIGHVGVEFIEEPKKEKIVDKLEK